MIWFKLVLSVREGGKNSLSSTWQKGVTGPDKQNSTEYSDIRKKNYLLDYDFQNKK